MKRNNVESIFSFSNKSLLTLDELLEEAKKTKKENVLRLRRNELSGACVIVRFLTYPYTYGILLEDKAAEFTGGEEDPMFGFVYGGIEDKHSDILQTAEDEVKEELIAEESWDAVRVTELDLIGNILIQNREETPRYLHWVIFAIDLPSSAKIRENGGEDQIDAFKANAEQIEDLISRNLMFRNHARAWEIYKGSNKFNL